MNESKQTQTQQINHRFNMLEALIDQQGHELKARIRAGSEDMTEVLALLGEQAEQEPEPLPPNASTLIQELTTRFERAVGRVKVVLLGCVILLGLTLLSQGMLWFGQRSLSRQIQLRTPSSSQIELMLRGWEQQKEEGHVQQR